MQMQDFQSLYSKNLLLLLLLTVSQVECAIALVLSNQLIKFELLTQSIRQRKLPIGIDPLCLYFPWESGQFFCLKRLSKSLNLRNFGFIISLQRKKVKCFICTDRQPASRRIKQAVAKHRYILQGSGVQLKPANHLFEYIGLSREFLTGGGALF